MFTEFRAVVRIMGSVGLRLLEEFNKRGELKGGTPTEDGLWWFGLTAFIGS